MGGSSSSEGGQASLPPEPPYNGPAVQYSFLDVTVKMTGHYFAREQITTDVDTYYPVLGEKYAEGSHMLTFYRIPYAAKRRGFFSSSVDLPFFGVFCRYPQSQAGWRLKIVKSTMVVRSMGVGLIQINQSIAGDTRHIYEAIVENTKAGGRMICIQMTGQQNRQGIGAAFSGVGPKMGVDVFFEEPPSPTSQLYSYQTLACPIVLQRQMSFGGTGVAFRFDWQGTLSSQLSQGWRLVEIFFDMGMSHRAFSTQAKLNTMWFFEKPTSRLNDPTPVYEGKVVEHFITLKGNGFSGVRAKTNWEPLLQEMGNQGWELACFVETYEGRMTGFGKAEIKILIFFQRLIFPPRGKPQEYATDEDAAAGFSYDTQFGVHPPMDEKPPPYNG